VAIMDNGRLIAAGPVAQIAHGSREVLIDCDDPDRAVGALERHGVVTRAVREKEGVLRVMPTPDTPVSELNRCLVAAGLAIERLEPVQATLEQRFLEITARMETAQ